MLLLNTALFLHLNICDFYCLIGNLFQFVYLFSNHELKYNLGMNFLRVC